MGGKRNCEQEKKNAFPELEKEQHNRKKTNTNTNSFVADLDSIKRMSNNHSCNTSSKTSYVVLECMIHHNAQNTIPQPKTATATPSEKAASSQDFSTDFQRFQGHQTLNHPCLQMNESLSNRKPAVSSMNESLSLFCGIHLLYIRKHLQHFFGLFAILFSSNFVI
jgi:hypothetical protein